MFITHRLIVDAGYAAARARLAQFVDTGGMAIAAHDSYQGVIMRVIRVGPAGEVPGASKLVQVRFVGPVERGGATTIWLHWEATGAAGGLFPALDADLILMAKGQEQTQLRLDGYYRPPLGRLGVAWTGRSCTVSPGRRSAPCCIAPPTRSPNPGKGPSATRKAPAASQLFLSPELCLFCTPLG